MESFVEKLNKLISVIIGKISLSHFLIIIFNLVFK